MVNTAYALNSYTQAKVVGGSPVDLIIMLYDGAIEFLHKAATGINMKNLHIKLKYISNALAIIEELDRSLDMDVGGEVAVNLRGLYGYMMTEIFMANVSNDGAKLLHIASLLKDVREGWTQIKDTVNGGMSESVSGGMSESVSA